jgi:hypothetical protein
MPSLGPGHGLQTWAERQQQSISTAQTCRTPPPEKRAKWSLWLAFRFPRNLGVPQDPFLSFPSLSTEFLLAARPVCRQLSSRQLH